MGKHARRSKTAQYASVTAAGAVLVGTAAAVPALPAQAAPAQPEHPVTPTASAHLDAVVVHTAKKVPTYTIKPGDTLSAIAQAHCGSAGRWPNLWAGNIKLIRNPNLIFPGQVIKLACKAVVGKLLGTLAPPAPKPAVVDSDDSAPAPPAPHPTARVTGGQGVISAGALAQLASLLDGQGYDGAAMANVASFLVAHGYSAAGAAGVDGCIAGESGGNPESVGDGGGGLIGWTPLSVPVTGDPSADLAAQEQALLSYDNANGNVGALNSQGGPDAAADYYSSVFERPAVTYSDVRYGVAQEVYAALGG